MMRTIGIDIGGTKCAVSAALDGDTPQLLRRIAFPTDREASPNAIIDEFIRVIRELYSEYGADSIGISCGSPLDSKRGVICAPPNLPKWDNVPITDILSREFSIPCYLQNDANACAMAEHRYGAGRGFDNMIFLTCGTGFGAGIIANGRIVCGAADNAGEIGHVSLTTDGPMAYGKPGSAEAYCGGGSFGLYAARELCADAGVYRGIQMTDISARQIFDWALEGDHDCMRLTTAYATRIGEAVAILVDLLNPNAIILGSIFARREGMLRGTIESTLRRLALPQSVQACRILAAELGDSIGDYAAHTVAVEGLNNAR